MDLSKLKSVRISPNARIKVCRDYFPEMEDEEIIKDNQFNERHLSMHAGALCLYATTLITKIYENSTEEIEYEASERELSIQNEIKSKPKFANLTDEEVKQKAHETILKEIRNSFAHGNFEISYDIYSQRLYFVLKPKHSQVDAPIIISKDALLKANKKVMSTIGRSFIGLDKQEIMFSLMSDSGSILKKFLLPSLMLNLAERYLDRKQVLKKNIEIEGYKIKFVQYCLLVAKITYEQDDYYKVFGKNSELFERISLIRNSIAHDGFEFVGTQANVDYTDRDKNLTEPIVKSIVMLSSISYQKEMLMYLLNNGDTQEEIQELKDGLKEMFDLFFTGRNFGV